MIDAERMLGSLVRNALDQGGKRGKKRRKRKKRRRRSGGSEVFGVPKAALAMGALGTAIAAFEHFSGKDVDRLGRGGGASAGPAPPPASLPPLPPTPGSSATTASGPPADLPPLPPTPTSPPSAAPSAPAPGEKRVSDAVLLIQAMIAAAHADHDLDAAERERILRAVDQSGASDEDRAFILDELEHPKSLAALAESASTPDLARQVYLASLMAIDVDTTAEESYLAKLAERLGLSPAEVDELEAMLGDSDDDPETEEPLP